MSKKKNEKLETTIKRRSRFNYISAVHTIIRLAFMHKTVSQNMYANSDYRNKKHTSDQMEHDNVKFDGDTNWFHMSY